MITLNLLKQKKAYVFVGLFLSTLCVVAQDPVETGNTEIEGVSLEYYFHQEPDTSTDPDKVTYATNILDGDSTTTWAGNVTQVDSGTEPILTFKLNGSYDLAEIQYLTVTKQYLFEVWVSTTETESYEDAIFVNITPTRDDNVTKDGTSYLASNADATYKSFDLGSNSGVTFVNIYCAGRTDSDWNTISELKFYEQGATASTRDNELSKSLLYPNPANDFVSLTNHTGKLSKVEVVSLEGKVILSRSVESSERELTLNTSRLSNGVYFVNLINETSTSNASKTIVVQH